MFFYSNKNTNWTRSNGNFTGYLVAQFIHGMMPGMVGANGIVKAGLEIDSEIKSACRQPTGDPELPECVNLPDSNLPDQLQYKKKLHDSLVSFCFQLPQSASGESSRLSGCSRRVTPTRSRRPSSRTRPTISRLEATSTSTAGILSSGPRWTSSTWTGKTGSSLDSAPTGFRPGRPWTRGCSPSLWIQLVRWEKPYR